MSGYPYDEASSSSAVPPPPYSVSASGSGSFAPESTSSSLHPPAPAFGYGASGSHSSADGLGILDSKWRAADPRSSSAQSLAPSFEDRNSDARRTLLIVYIHGFYGNESSFRSFPAHVHSYLKEALAETHAVHSKIYPRYKTYKAIDVARDNFSKWLEPHESETTDVVLVGHSMGGLLAGEVALMPNRHPYRRQQFKHRILGTVSLDSPFLGLHPGIVVAGISSLFRPASPPPEDAHEQGESSLTHLSPANSAFGSPNPSMSALESTSSLGTELSPSPSNGSSYAPPPKPDPFFNPPFFNDIALKDRSFMRRLGHFAKKHSGDGIWDAAKNHVMSHLEYGGCLADYPGLNARYNKLRALEDVDPLQHLRQENNPCKNSNQTPPSRVRFVNYYTLSTGRPKKPKSPKSPESPRSPGSELGSGPPSTLDIISQLSPQAPSTPRISVEDSDEGELLQVLEPIPMEDAPLSTLHEDRRETFSNKSEKAGPSGSQYDGADGPKEPKGKEKEVKDPEAGSSKGPEEGDAKTQPEQDPQEAVPAGDAPAEWELPPIPDLPEQPTPPDLDRYTDKDARKQAEKEAKRVQKAYEQAVKSREKAIKERQKLVEKRRKKAEKEAQKEAQRLEKEEQKRKQEQEKEEQKRKQEEEKEEQKRIQEEELARQRPEEAAQRRAEAAQRQAEAAQREAEAEQRRLEEALRQQPKLPSRPAAVETPPPAPTKAPPLPPRTPSATASTPQIAPESSAAFIATTQSAAAAEAASRAAPDSGKPKKERKFCTLPRKVNNRRDETWVSVFMEGVDEVGAHCGLFVPGPHYDRLIGDVGERIVGWVQDDLTARAILEIT
ncbi:catalytic protein [Colletotrichum plurivorum]|uniref:Catalytic protein n=1 Tax=Colletotrichum plurivorum TaxID=2175906 RepID=A0A8H6KR15_9PEZI|nr:catalytic protein [Colletotrichum plurivorum]